ENLDDAFADDVGILGGKLLQDRKHQFLLAQCAGVLDLQLFGKSKQLDRGLRLEVLQFHFWHVITRIFLRGMPARKKVGRWCLCRTCPEGKKPPDRQYDEERSPQPRLLVRLGGT